ncbi:MAG: CpsD/CapB family tyrosine-protein kinase [Anaerolineae bacterium]
MPEDGRQRLVTLSDPRSLVAEAYRSLRTNLEFSSLDEPLRTMIVTSPAPGTGKSTTLANLAVTMAQAGKQVILVDCDLRRPSLHEIFGVSNSAGLTSVILDDTISMPPLRETGVAGLRLLTSGPLPPNPAELLGSRRMADLIQTLQEQADMVLFDAPPVIAVADAAILASRVDGVLLVLNAGVTRRDHAQRAKAALNRVNARLVGTVLNNVKLDTTLYGYYSDQ